MPAEDNKGDRPSRGCTDVLCVPLFLGALGGLGYILHYASQEGDMARIYHGIDFHNQLCGVSEGVKDKPYLFWCAKPGAAMTEAALQEAGITDNMGTAVFAVSNLLDLAHPICVSGCPTAANTMNSCYQSQTVTDGPKTANGTFTKMIRYEYGLVADHPTTSIAERYCMPRTLGLLEQLQGTLTSGAEGFMFHAAEVMQHWHLVAASGALAVLLGYAYLFLVKTLARPLIYISFLVSSLACLGFGGYMLVGAFKHELKENFATHFKTADTTWSEDLYFPTTGYKRVDIGVGAVLAGLGFMIAIAGCCLKRSIDIVIGSLAATLECLQDMPIMLMQPLFGVIFRAVLMAVGFTGFLFVASIGEPSHYSAGDMIPAGFARTFSYEDGERWYIGGYVLVTLWVLEFGAALEQFMFIYGTQMWFSAEYSTSGLRRKNVSQCSFLMGGLIGMTFHFGTLAFGSAILAVVRTLYFVLSTMYKQVKATSGDKSNKVVDAGAGCCLCCLQCWEKLIRYLNKMAYIVVCMNSTNFCSAAETMIQIVASEFAAMGLLEGATKMFQVGGMITITGSGGYLSWLVLNHVHAFNSPESPHFVPQPEYITAAAAVASFVIAGVFMEVFDTVSDTILFCWALDKKNRKEQNLGPNPNLPAGLKRLLKHVEGSNDDEQTQPLVE